MRWLAALFVCMAAAGCVESDPEPRMLHGTCEGEAPLLTRTISVSFPGYQNPPRVWVAEDGVVWQLHARMEEAGEREAWLQVQGDIDIDRLCMHLTGMDQRAALLLAKEHFGEPYILNVTLVSSHMATPEEVQTLRTAMQEQMLSLPQDSSIENCYDGAHVAFQTWPDGQFTSREAGCAGTESFEAWESWFAKEWLMPVVS